MNDSNAALVLPMGVETNSTLAEVRSQIRMVKCKPGQGKLNRLIAKAQATLSELGHNGKRFKRDYASGSATYKCPGCGATATLDIHTKHISGDAVSAACAVVQTIGEVANG